MLSVSGTLPAGISASVAGSVVTLTGSASLASYQTAIAAIRFNNTSDSPDTTDRLINVVVNDGNNNSNTATTTIHVVAKADAPVLDLDGSVAGTGYTANFTENGAAVAIGDMDAKITDVDSTTIKSATIRLLDAQSSDVLAVGALPAGIKASLYDPATGTITISGTASLADYQTALRAITYNSTSDTPGTTRSIGPIWVAFSDRSHRAGPKPRRP